MERLTFDGNFCDIAQCRESPCPYNGACSQREVWERLKAYEDTGLTPESVDALKLSIMGKAISEITEFNGVPIARLKELAKADKDGRLVVRWIPVTERLPEKGAKLLLYVPKTEKGATIRYLHWGVERSRSQ